MLRCNIVSNLPESGILKTYINTFPQLSIQNITANASDLENIPNENADIIFADLMMVINDLQFLKVLRETQYVVFLIKTTSGFPFGIDIAANYFITTLDYTAVADVINEIIQYTIPGSHTRSDKKPTANDFLNLRVYENGRLTSKRILFEDIIYIKSSDNYSELYLEQKIQKVTPLNLKHVYELLNPDIFMRAHNRYLVNLQKTKYRKLYQLYLLNEEIIPIGRRYKKSIFKAINKHGRKLFLQR